MAAISLMEILVPKKRMNPKGTAYTNTFQPQNTNSVLSAPTYRSHLQDIFTNRVSQDSRTLLKDLVKYDSDVSATLHAFLTIADTEPRMYVYDQEGNLDREGQKQLEGIINAMTKRSDYTTGFTFTRSLRELAENFRYMLLLRGGVAGELVFSKELIPVEVRQVDMATVNWKETAPGVYKPEQVPPGSSSAIVLDIANFFVKYHRQNPTEIYPESTFVSSINTIAARQQVINDLYRIMQKTGYPRMEISVVEEVLRKNAPMQVQQNENDMRTWLNARLSEIAASVTDIRPDAVYVHTDAVVPKILNEKGPGAAFDVTSIIEVLNAQNQAGLKTMATIIGRGESGVNTASVEARVFSKSADGLNGPVADMLSDMWTFAMRMLGYQGYVECYFDLVELRPDMELEPQRIIKQQRLLQDLSLGLITDDEYHIEMHNRIRPDAAPELSGTGFFEQAETSAEDVSPNSDPLGRSVTPKGSKTAKSNSIKKKS